MKCKECKNECIEVAFLCTYCVDCLIKKSSISYLLKNKEWNIDDEYVFIKRHYPKTHPTKKQLTKIIIANSL